MRLPQHKGKPDHRKPLVFPGHDLATAPGGVREPRAMAPVDAIMAFSLLLESLTWKATRVGSFRASEHAA